MLVQTQTGVAEIQCRIGFEDGKLYVQNWMSAEGTRVNGQPMSEKTEVGLGDMIQVGPYEIVVEGNSPESQGIEPPSHDRNDQRPDAISRESELAEPCTEPSPKPSHTVLESFGGDDESSTADSTTLVADSTPLSRDTIEPSAADFDDDFFSFDEEETYDQETVALLRAEIEDLQAALAQRDAELHCQRADGSAEPSQAAATAGGQQPPDEVLQRIQDLVDEANQSDERAAMLEEMLHSSEAANRSEQDERRELEAWVSDIEKRIGQREAEHAAEVEALRNRLEESKQQQSRLQHRIQDAAFVGSAPQHYEETLENLQTVNQELEEKLAESEKRRLAAEQQLEQRIGEQDRALREERASIAKERAKVSRLRFELSSKLSAIEELPKPENQADKETTHRIQILREHLREIHEQEKLAEKEAPLTTRLAKLWKRVEY